MKVITRLSLVLVGLLWAASAEAWTVVNSVSKAAVDPGTTAAISTTGADLIVLVDHWFGGSVPSPSDSASNTWHALTQRSLSNINVKMFYATAHDVGFATSGTHTFTFGTTGTWFGAITVVAFSGSKTSADPFDSENVGTSSATTTVTTGGVTPAVSGSLIVSGLTVDGGTAYTATGYTVQESKNYSGGVNEGGAQAYKVQASGTESITWNWTTSGTGSSEIAAFLASGGGPATPGCKNGLVLLGAGCDDVVAFLARLVPSRRWVERYLQPFYRRAS